MFISDKSTIQCITKWRIINKDILEGKKKITYFSPGGYTFVDKNGRKIGFDWEDNCSNYDEKDNSIIVSEQYTIDCECITSCLQHQGYNDLIANDYRLDFFKDFLEFNEVHAALDIDIEEFDQTNNLECVHFELYDPISDKNIILIEKGEE